MASLEVSVQKQLRGFSLDVAFRAGERVRHSIFGPGTVVDDDPVKQVRTVQFDGLDTPRRLSFRVKLERL